MDDRDDLHSDEDRGGDTEEFDVSGDEEFGARRPGSALSGSSKKSGGKDKDAQKKGGLVAGTSPKISTRLIRTSSTSNPPSPHPGNGASPHGSPVTSHTPLTYSPRKPKRKTVVALYDFTATTADELTFKIGDRIAVTNEVVDGWWMGEILNANSDIFGGKKGMFPTSYTKVLPDRPTPTGSSNSSSSSVASNSGLRPALSRRRKTEEPGSGRTSLDGLGTARPSHRTTLSTGAVPGKSYPYPSPTPSSSDHSFASGDDHPFEDSEHPFGDHHHYISSGRSPINGHFYAGSITGSEIEEYDDERGSLVNPSAPDFPISFNGAEREKEKDVVAQLARRFSGPAPPVPPPPMTRRATDAAGSGKKPPPPPPPRRSANTASSTPTLSSTSLPPAAAPLPYIPRRPHTNPGTGGGSSTASSTTSSYLNIAQVGVGSSARGNGELDGIDSEGLTFSPFDDQVGCGSFKQNPFKAKGFCSNCMKTHS
ncbi:hypothetical protein NLI96_g13067 [Meripilus lineatus]|uniref:SH3 domain-containing protein n=1 Tax=Meripilus lineatus TaxID=2056292 RepID=A0AAD5UNP0_9APHY|nr:hypothetical protein NLI96_g13067 [Physisporinus lineatus]